MFQDANVPAQENGKLLGETTWEVAGAATWLRHAAATARTQIAGRAAEVVAGQYFQSIPEPVGVVGVISPWNSSVILTVRALGPALAGRVHGRGQAPRPDRADQRAVRRGVASVREIPPGVVNVLTETGSEVARHLVASEHVAMVGYTGSTAVGRQIAASAATTLKRLTLELGGKTPIVLFPSADLDIAIPALVRP